MYQNEEQKYKIRAVKIVLKLFKLAKQSCNEYHPVSHLILKEIHLLALVLF